MALAILGIIFAVLGILAVIGQILLYKGTKNTKNDEWIFIANMVLGVIISVMVFTSLPSNFIGQKGIALLWAILAVIALPLKLKSPNLVMLSKVLVTISIVGGLIQLFL